ncbi:MAG TPA: agmatine deiminase family protein [Bryobacteraceae bacterium]|jgi:agmatine deiminase|nr:agmatine deiminase family protein [Bryobacteraceae bacterium]
MPAEWEPHEATWIAWPHNEDDWPGRFEPIPWVYGEIVRKLAQFERVRILLQNVEAESSARNVLDKIGAQWEAIEFHTLETDRVWARDFAPLFVKNAAGTVAAVKWRFNGWAKYENHLRDEAAGAAIPGLTGVDWWRQEMVLEGGSVDVNGAGLLLTTEECLLSGVQPRNPDLSREEIEATLAEYLGLDRVLWLRNGIAGDDTHGHIDDLARFTDRESIVIVAEEDRSDVNYEPLRENWQIASRFGLRMRKLPMPAPVFFEAQRLPASYANFYIANRTVLVPTFNDPNDRVALGVLAECFPDRQVVGIHCLELVWGLGTLHCMTQQQPA